MLLQRGRVLSEGPPERVLTEALLWEAYGQRVVLSAAGRCPAAFRRQHVWRCGRDEEVEDAGSEV